MPLDHDGLLTSQSCVSLLQVATANCEAVAEMAVPCPEDSMLQPFSLSSRSQSLST